MRHLGLRAAIGVLALASGIDPGAAAPLDFLFGEPPLASRPAYRLRRRSAVPLTQRQPAQEAEVPLPVPRPHFPGDPPATTAEVAKGAPPEVAKPLSDAPPATPSPKTGAGPEPKPAEPATSPPLPPEKPVDLRPAEPPAAPPSPEPSKEASKSEGSKSETPKGEARKGPPAATTTPPAVGAPAPAPPAKPPQVAAPGATGPGPAKPAPAAVAPSGATTAFNPRSPEDDPQCPTRLAAEKIDVAPTDIGPQSDARCTVVQPVRLGGVTLADGAKVEFPERPTVACTTADSFGSFVRDLLVPLAKGTFGAPVTAVWTGPGLECRSRDHVFGAKLSAHGQGLAIDIARLKLADGRLVEVGMPKTDAETAFETAARAGACGYFHTVLGPGSDSYHRTHWHFDLEVRGSKGDSKYCK